MCYDSDMKLQQYLEHRLRRPGEGDRILATAMARVAGDAVQKAHEDEVRLPNEPPADPESVGIMRALLRGMSKIRRNEIDAVIRAKLHRRR